MKQRILDTLKMMGICFAVIVFFAFLAHGCDDDENESGYDAGYYDGYHDGYSDGYFDGTE